MTNCSECKTELIIGEESICQLCYFETTREDMKLLLKYASQYNGIPLDKLKGEVVSLKTASAFRVVQVVQEVRDE